MKIELMRDAILLVPECEQDRAYLEDTIGLRSCGDEVQAKRVDNISLGYAKKDEFCIKIIAR